MGNLFGIRKRAPQITAQDRAILQLKQQRDKIKIYQKRTEADLERSKELALKLFQNNMKERALIVLRRKKYMEDVLTRTDKQLETLESLVTDIEYTQIEVSVVEGLRVGTEALKQLNSLMNIDDIQSMMDDNAEAAEKQREISAILQQTSERYNDEDLLEELERYKPQPETLSKPIPTDVQLEPEKMQDSSNVEVSPISTDEARPAQDVAITDKLENLPDVPVESNEPEDFDSAKGTKAKNKRKSTSPQQERQLELAD